MHTTRWIVKSTAMVHRVPGSAGPHGMGSRIWSPRGPVGPVKPVGPAEPVEPAKVGS